MENTFQWSTPYFTAIIVIVLLLNRTLYKFFFSLGKAGVSTNISQKNLKDSAGKNVLL